MTSTKNKDRIHQQAVQTAEDWLCAITPETAALIEEAWQAANSTDADFAAVLYQRLFEVAPEFRPLFPDNMTEQGNRLTHTLEDVVNLVRDPHHLILLLRATGVRHTHYHIEKAHYEIMRTVMLEVIAALAKDRFTSAHREAWSGFYDSMAVIMQ